MKQPPFHKAKEGIGFVVVGGNIAVVDKKTWQIKQSCKPGNHTYDVKGFNPKIQGSEQNTF